MGNMEKQMKVVTFNIRCDYGQDGINNFEHRRGMIRDKIVAEKPDVIGFQETLPHVVQWLQENLPEYNFVGCGRDANFEDEAMLIAYRRSHVQLFALSTFWLSPTPQVPASRYKEQSICPRICTVATLKHKDWGTPVRLYNTHLDHEGAKARELGLTQVLERMRADYRRDGLPMILMGDFNAVPASEEMACMDAFADLKLSDLTEKIAYTFHNFGKQEHFCKIDYIFVGQGLRSDGAVAWDECVGGVYLSDHYPLCALVQEA